jgi:HD superfamily phosphohydrolase
MTSHSITLLKQKFDEIKRNINTIELKQREFFSHGLENKPQMPERPESFRHERPHRPASVSRFSETKPYDYDRNEDFLRKIRELEIEKQSLFRKLEEKTKENEDLKSLAKNQEVKIKSLQQENEVLKGRKENFQEKRPQSCIRDSKSPSKKNRVAFSKDLISVYPIDDNVPLVRASPQVPPAERGIFGGNHSTNHNPFHRNGFSDKYFADDLYRYRRMD